MHLYRSPLFIVTDSNGKIEKVTFNELVKSEGKTFTHSSVYLNEHQKELAQALVQNLFDRTGGIGEHERESFASGNFSDLDFDQRLETISELDGYELDGESPFMQVSRYLATGEQRSINALIDPGYVSRHQATNAFRNRPISVQKACAPCVAVGVYARQRQSPPKAQYFGAHPLFGKTAFTLEHRQSIRSSMALNLITEETLGSFTSSPVPDHSWVNINGDVGFVRSYERIASTGTTGFTNPASTYLAMVEGISLGEPIKCAEELCEVCNLPAEEFYESVSVTPDQKIFKALSSADQERVAKVYTVQGKKKVFYFKGKDRPIGDFILDIASTYPQVPTIPFVIRYQKNRSKNEVEDIYRYFTFSKDEASGYGVAYNSEPAWTPLHRFFKSNNVILARALETIDDPLEDNLEASDILINIFELTTKGGTNSSVLTGLVAAKYPFDLCQSGHPEKIGELIGSSAEVVKNCVVAWIKGLQALQSDVSLDGNSLKAKAPKGTKKKWPSDGPLIEAARRLWEKAYDIILQSKHDVSDRSFIELKKQLRAESEGLWASIRSNYQEKGLRLKDDFLIYKSNMEFKKFNNPTAGKRDDNTKP